MVKKREIMVIGITVKELRKVIERKLKENGNKKIKKFLKRGKTQ